MSLIVVRADASAVIGSGHVMRCLTLARSLRDCNRQVWFICREHAGHLCDLIQEHGFAVTRLPASESSWQADAEQTRRAIQALHTAPDWLIVDHYALDARWESVAKTVVRQCMVIDDLADRAHDCELLLDQNLIAGMYTRYVGRVPQGCALMLGPEYALLQPAYAELHDRIPPRSGKIRRILVFFGAADLDNLAGRAISAFLTLSRPDIELDVVIAPGTPQEAAVRQQIAGHRNIHLHLRLPSLADLIARADLAIGAGGATSWERLCLGLPALVITLADNQRPIAEKLEQAGLIRWLGHADTVDLGALTQALGEVLREDANEQWSLRCSAAVDGRGLQRVRTALTVNHDTRLRARYATVQDENLLLCWANDPVTRSNGFAPEPISAATHHVWFRARLRDLECCHFFIIETDESIPLGQVRFDKVGDDWKINYALAPQFRGRGCGAGMLRAALAKLRRQFPSARVWGQVKETNLASRRVFESLGFEARPAEAGVIEYIHWVN